MCEGPSPNNGARAVPWTIFKDDVQMGFFDVYDQYLLNILYDPRLRPGMTKDDVDRVLPAIFPTARAWVATVNHPRSAEQRDEPGRGEAASMPKQSVTALMRSTEVSPSH